MRIITIAAALLIFTTARSVFAAAGFMEGQAWLWTVVVSLMIGVWLLVFVGLIFFRMKWRSRSRAIRVMRWMCVLAPLVLGVPAFWIWVRWSAQVFF